MLIISLIAGLIILIFGRYIFWLSVAALGFILGITYATQIYSGQPEWVIAIGIAGGLIGALAAILLQKLAAGLFGFMAGWYISATMIAALNLDFGEWTWIVPLFAGVMGVLLVGIILDWSLIILSSFAGATIITQLLPFNQPTINILLGILFVLGVAIQALSLSRSKE